ncbi:MAG: hypothetical protein JWO80_6351 [Bryobacterales bacterium]|jgi:hypothetical protein|nr:hypothetical protein [Bryobacterales bacterium]
MNYESNTTVPSRIQAGVSYAVARMSFGRRVELMKQVRELAGRLEFLQAGPTDDEQMHAKILGAEIDRVYLRWGLQSVSGLEIDGQAATPESLANEGPEDLFREALAAVKSECGLSEQERKN